MCLHLKDHLRLDVLATDENTSLHAQTIEAEIVRHSLREDQRTPLLTGQVLTPMHHIGVTDMSRQRFPFDSMLYFGEVFFSQVT